MPQTWTSFPSHCAFWGSVKQEWHFVFKYSLKKKKTTGIYLELKWEERRWKDAMFLDVCLTKSHLPAWLVFEECPLVTRIISNNTNIVKFCWNWMSGRGSERIIFQTEGDSPGDERLLLELTTTTNTQIINYLSSSLNLLEKFNSLAWAGIFILC